MCDVAAVASQPLSPARPGGAFSLWAAAQVSGFACRNLQTVNRTRIVEATLVTAIKPAMVPAHGDVLGSPGLVTGGSIGMASD